MIVAAVCDRRTFSRSRPGPRPAEREVYSCGPAQLRVQIRHRNVTV